MVEKDQKGVERGGGIREKNHRYQDYIVRVAAGFAGVGQIIYT